MHRGCFAITALEKHCYKKGPGIQSHFLEDLRKTARVNGIEERKLNSGGYSYFPEGAGRRGRIFKIAEVKDRLYLEFNIFVPLATETESIVWLTSDDRRILHAGGVVFCYIGSDFFKDARGLITQAIKEAADEK